MKIKNHISFIFLWVCLLQTYAGDSREIFYHLNYSSGLTNLFVTSIAQDHQGFIWVGTEDGLFRYDGYEFKLFKYQVNNTKSLSNNKISNVFVDSKGTLWITTANGLNFYHSKNESFTRIMANKNNSHGLPNNLVQVVFEDSQEQIWIGHYDGVSKLIDRESLKFENIKFKDKSCADNWIGSICEDQNGNIWFGALFREIYKFNVETGNIQSYFDVEKLSEDFRVNKIIRDQNGEILIGSFNDGIFSVNNEKNSLQKHPLLSNKKFLRITDMFIDSQKRFWIATNEGLIMKGADDKDFNLYLHDPLNKKSVSSNAIECLFEDKNGTFWIGTRGKGLDYFARPSVLVGQINKTSNPDFPDNLIEGLLYIENALYFTSQNLGTYRIQGNKLEKVMVSSNPMLIYDGKRIFSERAYFDIETNITGSLQLESKVFNSVCYHDEGDIYVLSKDLDRYNHDDLRKKESIVLEPEKEQEQYERVHKLLFHGNDLYILDSRCLYLYSEEHKNYRVILKSKEIEGNRFGFNNMIIDGESCWIISSNELYKYDLITGEIKKYNENRLLGNTFYSIIADNEHDVWFATNKGIFLLDTKTDKTYCFNESDGVHTMAFTAGIAKSEDNKIYFGTGEGIVVLDKKTITPNSQLPNIVFTSFRLFDKNVQVADTSIRSNDFALENSINEVDELILKYNQNFISFGFAALNFRMPLKNQYKVMMFGLEDEWKNIGNQTTISYNGLPPGQYVLKVMASNNDGYWTPSPKELRIIIKPPFWKTALFRILLIFSIAVILFVIYRIRLNAEKRKKKELELLVRQRTVEVVAQKEEIQTQAENVQEINVLLKENQEELQAQAEELFEANTLLQELNKTKDKFFSIIAHDLRNPFHAINGFTDLILKDFEVLDKDKAKEFIRLIKGSSRSAAGLLENLMVWARSQTGKIEFKPDQINLSEIVIESFSLLQLNAEKKHISLINKLPDDLSAFADKNMMTTVIRNLINNAIKFTPSKGNISVYGKIAGDSIELIIEDTGIGMTEPTIAKLFKIDQQVSTTGTDGEAGTGLGLLVCKEFVDKNSGCIRVESIFKKGSKFIIHLPQKKGGVVEEIVLPKVEEKAQSIEKSQPEKTVEAQDKKEEKALLLIVEDTIDIRIGLKGYLENDFEIIEAGNGIEGLKYATDLVPDIIITDWMMPQMDGIELTEKLKTDNRTCHIPVIMLTAKSTPSNKIEGFETGADEYMVKPFNYEVLKARLNNLIQSRILLQKILSGEEKKDISEIDQLSHLDKTFLENLQVLLVKNLDNSEFSINESEKELGMSRPQIYRKIKALTGLSPNHYVRNYRLNEAAKLLKKKDFNVSEVMYAVGFNNASYFTKKFKELFGCTPTEYPKANQ